MKALIPLLFLVSVAMGQDSTKPRFKFRYSEYDTTTPQTMHTIRIMGSANKFLQLEFSGDSLKTSGTLHLDSAATVFFEYCIERYAGRIQSLKDTIEYLRRKGQ